MGKNRLLPLNNDVVPMTTAAPEVTVGFTNQAFHLQSNADTNNIPAAVTINGIGNANATPMQNINGKISLLIFAFSKKSCYRIAYVAM